MANVKVKLNLEGIRALKHSQPIVMEVVRRSRRGLEQTPAGFEWHYRPGRKVGARAVIWTSDEEGRKAEAEDKILIRALDAMR
jgi:hypothetical protein